MEDRYAITIAMGFLMAVLATLAVSLRFVSRSLRQAQLLSDDFLIVAALVATLGICVAILVGGFAGKMGTFTVMGSNGPEVNEAEHIIRDKTIWIVQWLAPLAFGFTKLSVLCFYKRIFMGKLFMIATWTLIALSAAWTTGFFFANLLNCLPIQANWIAGGKGDSAYSQSTCVNIVYLFRATAISDIILDALILTLPWYPVWRLQMPIRQKIVVCGIFLLGAFVVIAGALRLWGIQQALTLDYNHTYKRAPAFYWSGLEAGTGVVSACLPTLRPLFTSSKPASIISTIRERLRSPSSGTRPEDSESSLKYHASQEQAPSITKEPRFDEFDLYLGQMAYGGDHLSHAEGLASGGAQYPAHAVTPQSSFSRDLRSIERV